MLGNRAYPRNGVLIDLGYAVDLDPDRHSENSDKENTGPILKRRKSDGNRMNTRAYQQQVKEQEELDEAKKIESKRRTVSTAIIQLR